jgi:hypothetical protein
MPLGSDAAVSVALVLVVARAPSEAPFTPRGAKQPKRSSGARLRIQRVTVFTCTGGMLTRRGADTTLFLPSKGARTSSTLRTRPCAGSRENTRAHNGVEVPSLAARDG